uniref:Methyltransferase FkbM domain-containing protein n=1 Tax=viral metagenome TaxID=1070528 RepID=A0A6C0J303_9ZZZZ
MKIFYGIENNKLDVTEICNKLLKKNDIITIPKGDGNRAYYFTDKNPGLLKSIFIHINDIETKYNDLVEIEINTLTNEVIEKIDNIDFKLQSIHKRYRLDFGSFQEELPEQKMAVKFLTGNEKVLEIGGNIGRNTIVIADILNTNNFVTLESDSDIANQLKHNRDINNMSFIVEESALSKRKLIQKVWETIPSDELLPGYKIVNTITWQELNNKYNIIFDTLVLDCEGAFYYILQDMPEVLDNINLIIMENDYHNIEHKKYIDNVLKNKGFNVVYSEAGGWGCCYNNFFEVWKLA